MRAADLISLALRLAVNLSLIGAPIAAGTVIAFKLTRVGPPRIRYLVAVLSFFLAAALPIGATFGALERRHSVKAFPLDGIHDASRTAAPNPDGQADSLSLETVTVAGESTSAILLNGLIEWLVSRPLGGGLLALWVIVASLLLIREARGHVALHRARREWEPATMELRRKLAWPDDIPLFIHGHDGPATVGLLRPAVVLPARLLKEFSIEAVQRIAAHEQAHVRWLDPLVNALLRVVSILLWPSFPQWLLLRVCRTEREAAADWMAISRSAGKVRGCDLAADYAETLVALAKWSEITAKSRYFARAATSAGGGIILEERVRRLLASAHRSRGRMLAAIAVALTCLISTSLLPVLSDSHATEEQRGAAAVTRISIILSDLPDGREKARVFQPLDAMSRLFAGLKGRNWDLKGETAAVLEQIRQSGVIEPLLVALKDEDEKIREKSAWALGEIGDRRAVVPLVNSLSRNPPRVRQTIAWALGMIRDADAVAPLILRLKEDDWPDVRQSSAWALGMIGNPQAVEPLIAGLTDNWPDVRHGSAWALGRIGDVRAIEPLRAVVNEERDEDVRQVAAGALARLSSR